MQKVWAALLGIESFMIISANVMAIRIFLKKKFIISKSSYLLVNLTVADIFVGISAFITLLEIQFASEMMFVSCKGNLLNDMSITLSIFTVIASLFSLAMMAFERALAVLTPFRFRQVQNKHYIYGIVMCWVSSLMVWLKNIDNCSDAVISKILRLFMTLVVSLSILTIIVSYSAIFVKVRFLGPAIRSTASMQNSIKLSKTLVLTTLVALLTWMPRYVAYILQKQYANTSTNVSIAAVMVIYSNSFANLLVYSLRMPHFRREMKKMLHCKRTVTWDNRVNEVPSANGRGPPMVIPLSIKIARY